MILMQRAQRALLLLPRHILMRNPGSDMAQTWCKLASYEVTEEEKV